MFKLGIFWRRLRGQLWFRPTIWSLLATAVALLAAGADLFFDKSNVPDIKQDTLEGLLKIIAASMLTVSTFSLSIMVSAFASTASNATPRATRMVMADNGAQSAIAAFVSAFIFSMISLTALGLNYYGATGRFVLLICTIAVLAYLILALLRWISTLTRLGRMSNTLRVVESVAFDAMKAWTSAPFLGAMQGDPERAPMGQVVHAPRTGYLQYVHVKAIEKLACQLEGMIHVRVRPGDFVAPASVVAVIVGNRADADQMQKLVDCFSVGRDRTEDQDPRFGMQVLAEVAQRALSPAVNDPGTAILAVSAMARVLIDGTREDPEPPPTEAQALEHVTLVPINPDDLLKRVIDPVARDGAALLEVGRAVQEFLAAVGANTHGSLQRAALAEGVMAFEHSEQGLVLQRERDELRALIAGKTR